jgi:hypothetical protein
LNCVFIFLVSYLAARVLDQEPSFLITLMFRKVPFFMFVTNSFDEGIRNWLYIFSLLSLNQIFVAQRIFLVHLKQNKHIPPPRPCVKNNATKCKKQWMKKLTYPQWSRDLKIVKSAQRCYKSNIWYIFPLA